jgi:glycerophosphoryl diester phosphodiesterase
MAVDPYIIGHRGACGYLPEHTVASIELACRQGADAIEVDVAPTRDGHLVCRHDAELSLTTDVADHREFANRRSERTIEGASLAGWFIDDFTLAEIQTLRARQRFAFRDQSYNDTFPVPSLREAIALVATQRTARGKPLEIVIELKHPAYFASRGLDVEEPLLRALQEFGYLGSESPAWVESFEVGILRRLRTRTSVRLIQLLDEAVLRPADVAARGETMTFGRMIEPAGLREIASYASAIGAWKRLIVPTRAPAPGQANVELRLDHPSNLISDAHAAGLHVHAWTFRNERRFLAAEYAGDPMREYRQFLDLGLDGFITDFPDAARACKALCESSEWPADESSSISR